MNGIINLIKPKGISSFKCVAYIKKITGIKKVGHTGTLDPEAEGVLPICIGKATKIIDFIMTNNKEYVVKFKLGMVTDTYDLEGTVLKEYDYSNITEEMINESIKKFVGDIKQVPPMYSALKKNGVRLYELARQGIEIDRPARDIKILAISDLKVDIPYVSMRVNCSKGTYIRSLCYDIGEDLGVGATMTELKRTANGRFHIKDGICMDDLTAENISDYLIPMDEALNDFPIIHVNDYFSKLLINGVKVNNPKITNEKLKEEVFYRVYNESNDFIGIGLYKNGAFKMDKLLL